MSTRILTFSLSIIFCQAKTLFPYLFGKYVILIYSLQTFSQIFTLKLDFFKYESFFEYGLYKCLVRSTINVRWLTDFLDGEKWTRYHNGKMVEGAPDIELSYPASCVTPASVHNMLK